MMIKLFRIIAFLEGLSFLILLFIAMPMKYVMNQPEYVRVIGMAHGLLFMAYILILIYGNSFFREKYEKAILYKFYLASVIPFGTFYIDYKFLRGD